MKEMFVYLDVPDAFVASYGRNAAIVLPVIRDDGTQAVLKLQEPRDETTGAVIGLRAWAGDGVVRLLEGDAATGAMLLEPSQVAIADVLLRRR